ncbi:hypothetical protein QUF88_24850 [Bacillus sp. DX1.1]|uniref:hypothetical protein n=1 Tax=unclassified Bacillus (in: firmicutes) TaxID=185979 RepID=UPI00257107F3|nr:MULTISPECIES: hypothetical protein [unclassified Bacillus (in: firmicutes)]MDM5156942.1 hypothetical protein [Bacillus sp. DX1.1]WJE81183.1 hypothetical protein QRE67_22390 [Bacillus sp. DX3.1]
MIDFLVLILIFVAGFMIMQVLIYRFAKKTVHKYRERKLIHIWLDMNVKKGPKLDFTDFTFLLILCIIWKIWLFPLIK